MAQSTNDPMMRSTNISGPPSGLLLVLCLLLTVWEPASLAWLASAVLPHILDRPAALAILALRVVVTAVGLAAGITLWRRRPHAVGLAKVTLVLSALTVVLLYSTPYFPSNRMPGDALPMATLLVGWNGVWFVYLTNSKRAARLKGISGLRS